LNENPILVKFLEVYRLKEVMVFTPLDIFLEAIL